MKVYLVGGAVRDRLLKYPVQERDWVVVGATPQEMLQRGFKKVGKDFPVFLHPHTHEEYALARTERKVGKGYTNFVCYASSDVTLEEDLKRRDLTINAMAEDTNGNIIDPYHGQQDLKQRILRHVSLAFAEDSVRILRIARFAARLGHFKVHPKTNKLMQTMVTAGEVDALVPERVWQELERALGESYPEKFFLVLKNCQALAKLFPAIAESFAINQKALKRATTISPECRVRLGALAFNFTTLQAKKFFIQYKLPNVYRETITLLLRLKEILPQTSSYPEKLVTLLETTDAYRKFERLHTALLAYKSNLPSINKLISQIHEAHVLTKNIRLTSEEVMQTTPHNIKDLLHVKRVAYLANNKQAIAKKAV